MLAVFGHDDEGFSQLADFGAALDVDSLRKVSARNGSAEMSEDFERIRNPAGGENTDTDTKSDGHQGQDARVALHLIYAAVGLGAWLLHDHSPVKVGHGAVGAEHSDVGIAIAKVEFPGRSHHLHLGACLDEVA